MRLTMIAAAAGMTLAATAAEAAPQVLGVMASRGAIPLTCGRGLCSVEVTAFCLQEARGVPPEATPYQTVGATAISILLYRADGAVTRLPGSEAALASARGFTALTVSVPETLLQRYGAVDAAVEVADGATVEPIPVAGDPRPQSAEEVALAAGPMRAFATQRLEQGPVATAARLTERLINALPPRDLETPPVRNALSDKAIAALPQTHTQAPHTPP